MSKQVTEPQVQVLDTYGVNIGLEEVLDVIMKVPANTKFVLFCPREHTPVSTGQVSGVMSKVSIDKKIVKARKYVDKNNIKLDLVLGRLQYPEFISHIDYLENVPVRWNDIFLRLFDQIHYLSDWWLKESTWIYIGTHHSKATFPMPYGKLQHICAVRSGLAHPHRSLTMDMLAKYDLINDTCSWRQLTEVEYPYEFKYWDEKIMLPAETMLVDEDHPDQDSIYTSIHDGAMNSLIEIIPESCVEYIFITEKTTKWLLYGKVFVIIGAPGIHSTLRKLGFELFDELFDYEFDNIHDMDERVENIVKQIAELNKKYKTPASRKKLLQKLQPKIEKNLQNLMRIVGQDYPEELRPALDSIEFYDNINYARSFLEELE